MFFIDKNLVKLLTVLSGPEGGYLQIKEDEVNEKHLLKNSIVCVIALNYIIGYDRGCFCSTVTEKFVFYINKTLN